MDIHQFGKIPSLTTRLHKNDIWQTWGHRLQEKIMIYLTPERGLCFLFDQASPLRDSELSQEVLLEEVLCKSRFPHRQHGQPACWPATSTQPLYSELSSSPGVQTRMPWRWKSTIYTIDHFTKRNTMVVVICFG